MNKRNYEKLDKIIEYFAEVNFPVSASNKVVDLLNDDKLKSEDLMEFMAQIRLQPEFVTEETKIYYVEVDGIELVGFALQGDSVIVCLKDEEAEHIDMFEK